MAQLNKNIKQGNWWKMRKLAKTPKMTKNDKKWQNWQKWGFRVPLKKEQKGSKKVKNEGFWGHFAASQAASDVQKRVKFGEVWGKKTTFPGVYPWSKKAGGLGSGVFFGEKRAFLGIYYIYIYIYVCVYCTIQNNTWQVLYSTCTIKYRAIPKWYCTVQIYFIILECAVDNFYTTVGCCSKYWCQNFCTPGTLIYSK